MNRSTAPIKVPITITIFSLLMGVGVMLSIAGAEQTLIAQSPSPSPSVTLPPAPTDNEEVATDEPKRFKIQVSLRTPNDLKVREGDNVRVGQIISDRRPEREKLEAQREKLALQLKNLGYEEPGKPIPEVAPLPPPTFLENMASINSAQLKVDEANKRLALQQRKLDFLKGLPEGEVPRVTIDHEEIKLKEREEDVSEAISGLQLAQARLTQAQKDRAYEEYQHSLELAKLRTQQQQQQMEREKQERDRQFQLAQLQNQLTTLDQQITQLSAVRSPYNAKVKKIKWLEQTDQILRVEVGLDLRSKESTPSAP